MYMYGVYNEATVGWGSSLSPWNRVLRHISSFLFLSLLFVPPSRALQGRQRSDAVRHILPQFSKTLFCSVLFSHQFFVHFSHQIFSFFPTSSFHLKIPTFTISLAASFLFGKFFVSSKWSKTVLTLNFSRLLSRDSPDDLWFMVDTHIWRRSSLKWFLGKWMFRELRRRQQISFSISELQCCSEYENVSALICFQWGSFSPSFPPDVRRTTCFLGRADQTLSTSALQWVDLMMSTITKKQRDMKWRTGKCLFLWSFEMCHCW